MKILVTGGSGFIGKPLVRALDAKGYKVSVFCREDDIDRPDNVQLFTGNITNKTALRRAFSGVDAVYHLAASQDEDDPKMPETNIVGTQKLIELCKENKIKQLIFMSFAGVFGEMKYPRKEHENARPKTKYDQAKIICENMIKNSGLTYTIIRTPIVIGANIFWAKTVEAVKKGEPMAGSGKNKIHLVHVEDVIRMLLCVLNNRAAANHVFHVAAKDVMTYEEIYEAIQRELKIKKTKRYRSLRAAHIYSTLHWLKCAALLKQPSYHMSHNYISLLSRDYHLSIQKAKDVLGFEPKFTTPAAIHEMICDLF